MSATAIRLVINIWHDDMPECPSDMDGWKVYSFSRRHHNFKDPNDFDEEEMVELQSKLDSGLAFKLSYFEHGLCQWSLMDEGPQCRWDSVQFAGLVIWEQDESDLGPKSYEDRQADARAFIDRYTQWCNGEVYGFSIDALKVCECCGQDVELSEEEADGPDLASVGGFYGDDLTGMVEAIKEHIGADPETYEVTFEDNMGGSMADEIKRLWKEDA